MNMNGICMEYARMLYGKCMEYAWNMHGICMEYVWEHAYSITYSTRIPYSYSIHMEYVYGVCKECIWNTYGICMEYAQGPKALLCHPGPRVGMIGVSLVCRFPVRMEH
jgi:hypothetical protein